MEPIIQYSSKDDLLLNTILILAFFTFGFWIMQFVWFRNKTIKEKLKMFLISFVVVLFGSLIFGNHFYKINNLIVAKVPVEVYISSDYIQVGKNFLKDEVAEFYLYEFYGPMSEKNFKDKIASLKENPKLEYNYVVSSKSIDGTNRTQNKKYIMGEDEIKERNGLENFYKVIEIYEEELKKLTE